jgi:hypothetical protein
LQAVERIGTDGRRRLAVAAGAAPSCSTASRTTAASGTCPMARSAAAPISSGASIAAWANPLVASTENKPTSSLRETTVPPARVMAAAASAALTPSSATTV